MESYLESTPSLALLPIWERLRGRGLLWHRTSLLALEGILRDGEIKPNAGQLPNSYGQSKISYGQHLGAVSLFDFDTADEPHIFDHKWKWDTVLFKPLPDAGVAIGVQRDALDRRNLLLPTEISNGDDRLASLSEEIRKMRMCIPAVEALHLGPISVKTFNGFILLTTENGGYLWNEVPVNPDAYCILSAISTGWISDYERRTMQRHARGEYSLAGRLEAAIRSADKNR